MIRQKILLALGDANRRHPAALPTTALACGCAGDVVCDEGRGKICCRRTGIYCIAGHLVIGDANVAEIIQTGTYQFFWSIGSRSFAMQTRLPVPISPFSSCMPPNFSGCSIGDKTPKFLIALCPDDADFLISIGSIVSFWKSKSLEKRDRHGAMFQRLSALL